MGGVWVPRVEFKEVMDDLMPPDIVASDLNMVRF
jgi:hypothetical protein